MIQNNTLDLRASQQLAMTPRLQQAIQLLQMSTIDLNDYLQEQLIDNPLLMDDGQSLSSEAHDGQESLHYDIKDNDSDDDYISQIKQPITLKEFILEQFMPLTKNQSERFLANILIDGLDENGYFTEDLKLIAERFKVDHALVESIFKRLQECEPVGVFSRDLKECFMLQLRDKNLLDENTQLILDHLNQLPDLGIQAFCKKLKIDLSVGAEILNSFKKLIPKPGLLYEKSPVQNIICDINVFRSPLTNEWTVELNQDSLPRIFLNTSYYQELQSKCRKGEEIIYLKDKKNHASWLLSALMQRSTNILKVAKEIVRIQNDFFEKGVHALSPLTLKEVALKTDLHESTISRLTTNKYMRTPFGILDFKFFFNSKLKTNRRYKEEGVDLSSKSVMDLIKKMIQQERADQPLSDDDLSILLKQEGVNIARRTIAKYRTILKIENSAKRKRYAL